MSTSNKQLVANNNLHKDSCQIVGTIGLLISWQLIQL